MATILTKKDKGTAAPEANVCAHCLAPEGSHGVVLKVCTRCKATHYCGRACQTAHWRAGHKQFCVTPEERATQPASSTPSTHMQPPEEDLRPVECAVCLDPLASGAGLCTLPCTHTFHAACVEGMRKFGIQQVCPMCRVELPPGPEQLFEEAGRWFLNVQLRVDRGESSWGALTKAQQREMDEVARMLRSAGEQGHARAQFLSGVLRQAHSAKHDDAEAVRWYRKAADQGVAEAQFNLGTMFDNGEGVQQDDAEAARWYLKAAEQGHAQAQFNLGTMHVNGQGMKKDNFEAARWYLKAAEQGVAIAQLNIGALYNNGQGVKKSYSEAVQWYRKAADQGYAEAQYNLGIMYYNGHGVQQDTTEAMRWWRKAAAQGHAQAKQRIKAVEDHFRAAAAAKPAASSPRACAQCGAAETAGGNVALKPCSRCKAAVYCGRECQAAHWKAGGHREVCKEGKKSTGI